jgi:hypothetical protein
MNTTRYKSTFGFVDLLFNLLVGFTFLFVLAFILINPVAKKEVHDPKAEYLVIMSWDDDSQSDIDLWIKDDKGIIVSFRSKDVGLLTLDRDDLGTRNDEFISEMTNKKEVITVNREVLSIRSKSPRRFIVTSHFYNKSYNLIATPRENIQIELIQVNPYKILKIKEITLEEVKQEKHVFEFEVLEGGGIVFHESSELIIGNFVLKTLPYMDQR